MGAWADRTPQLVLHFFGLFRVSLVKVDPWCAPGKGHVLPDRAGPPSGILLLAVPGELKSLSVNDAFWRRWLRHARRWADRARRTGVFLPVRREGVATLAQVAHAPPSVPRAGVAPSMLRNPVCNDSSKDKVEAGLKKTIEACQNKFAQHLRKLCEPQQINLPILRSDVHCTPIIVARFVPLRYIDKSTHRKEDGMGETQCKR